MASSPPVDATYTRLHITPLHPSLLSAVIPPSMSSAARNISYHALQTFPEKTFGYVDLPIEDAVKLKKKLNGTILKGTKMRVEDARDRRGGKGDGEQFLEQDPRPEEKKTHGKKRKWEGEVMEAVELRDRKVKRGWTEEKAMRKAEKKSSRSEKGDKKERVKSKYTTGPECLFKTGVPLNIAAKLEKKDKVKEKRAKVTKEPVLVHEFEKTVKHATFLRGPTSDKGKGKQPLEFVEGKGWVDAAGMVVEEVNTRKRPAHVGPVPSKAAKDIESNETSDTSSGEEVEEAEQLELKPATTAATAASETSSDEEEEEEEEEESSDSSEDESSEAEESSKITPLKTLLNSEGEMPTTLHTDTSSSADSSSENEGSVSSSSEEIDDEKAEPEEEEEEEEEEEASAPPPTTPKSSSRPVSSSGAPTSLSITIPSPALVDKATVHPLEALYKRTAPDANKAEDTSVTPKAAPSFSFFDANGDDMDGSVDDEAGDRPPMTPFTAADMSFRGLRSAAPTPDTAHPSRINGTSFPWNSNSQDDNEMEDSDGDDEFGTEGTPSGNRFFAAERKDEEVVKDAEATSDFQKWFWENRGEVNRGWKKRRKVVSKEKRQRENRKRGEQRV